MTLVIGLMSGTSVDGIDAALVDLSDATGALAVTLLAGATYPYPTELRAQILAVCGGASLSMADLADLDDAIAHQFAQAAIAIQTGHPTAALIGSHGQTVYHRPPKKERREESREKWLLPLTHSVTACNWEGETRLPTLQASPPSATFVLLTLLLVDTVRPSCLLWM